MREQEQTISALNVELDKLRTVSKDCDLSAFVKLADDSKVDLGLKRRKAIVECSIGGIDAFVNASTSKTLRSRYFFCDGLAWSVEVKIQKFEGVRYLSVYLSATNFADVNWPIKAAYQVKLLNRNPLFNVSMRPSFSDSEFSKHSPSWGQHKFTTIDNLCSNGYIKNDEIKFRVDLSVKKSAPPSSFDQYALKHLRFLYVLAAFILIVLSLILVKLYRA